MLIISLAMRVSMLCERCFAPAPSRAGTRGGRVRCLDLLASAAEALGLLDQDVVHVGDGIIQGLVGVLDAKQHFTHGLPDTEGDLVDIGMAVVGPWRVAHGSLLGLIVGARL